MAVRLLYLTAIRMFDYIRCSDRVMAHDFPRTGVRFASSLAWLTVENAAGGRSTTGGMAGQLRLKRWLAWPLQS